MRWKSAWVVWIGVLAWLALPRAAWAQEVEPLSISVLSVQTDDAFDQADALTKALRTAVRDAEGWSLDEADHSLEVIALSLQCDLPPDSRCQTRIADKIGVDRFVWATAKLEGDQVVGALHMWRRGQGTASTDLRYSSNLTEAVDSALQEVAKTALDQVTGGPPTGKLQIRVGTLPGEVFVDGQSVGALNAGQGLFRLPAGPHEIVVRSEGYTDVRGSIVIKPNETERLVLTPEPVEAESDTDWGKIGGFIGVGMGVAFGTVGLVSSLKVNGARTDNEFEEYRRRFPESEDVCESAEASPAQTGQDLYVVDLCNQAATFEIMQAVFYPLAAISGGVGLYLLATSDWGDDASEEQAGGHLRIDPRVGPQGGGVSATYTW
jgi:hypothetical protein